MTDVLSPYQVEGAAFIAQRPRAGLFDAPGLGKTAQAIRALDTGGLIRGIDAETATGFVTAMMEIL